MISLTRLLAVLLLVAVPVANAGPLRDWLASRHEADSLQDEQDDGGASLKLPAGTRAFRDLAYGPDARQRIDVYLPAGATKAPLLVMVHGGAWRYGDKTSKGVVTNKADHWLPRGIGLVSVNYRMLPETPPEQQAQDVAAALGFVQTHAAEWGADPAHVVLMGHSAGAHLVSLLAVDPERVARAGGQPWLGTVVLDSAAVDVEAVMQRHHAPFYDAAFGSDPAGWRAMSPLRQLTPNATPLLFVCSTRRRDHPCDQANEMVAAAQALKVRAELLPQPLSHMDINATLGTAGAYTDAVDDFLSRLDPVFAAHLRR